ncbi:MAG: hypothetical protein ACE5I9_07280 [Candidatus Methylomirabilales bacterium]
MPTVKSEMDTSDLRVEETLRWFSRIYLGGIPSIITDDSAFLSFVCILTATEALAGYRYGNGSARERFKKFVMSYFPDPYAQYADDLWQFRNKIIHAFSTGRFALTHHHSELHFRRVSDGAVILNAEDFYSALLSAAQRYFAEVRATPELQRTLVERLESAGGGSITVAPIKLEW